MVFLTTGNIEDKRKLFEFNVPFEQTNVTSLFEKIKRKLFSIRSAMQMFTAVTDFAFFLYQ